MKNAKKIILSVGVVLVFIAYTWQQRHDTSSPVITLGPTPAQTQSSSSTSSNSQTSQSSGSNTSRTSPTYKNGQYTGTVADAFYGNIQVEVVISGGKITDVQFLQYPNDRQNSIFINQQAMPILKQEAIQAQSAHVNVVSGATDTSMAFVQSLTDALNQAV